jgi:predicted transcriptional regulator
MPNSALSLDLPDELDRRLDQVSARTNRPKTSLVREALAGYLDQFDWKSREIEAAIAEADAGVFVSHEAMLQWARSLSGQPDASVVSDALE